MNLYLLLAIAFGAISGFSEPPAAPRAFASIVDVRNSRAARRQIADVRSTFPAAARSDARPASFTVSRVEAPLTGSASPRAPAL